MTDRTDDTSSPERERYSRTFRELADALREASAPGPVQLARHERLRSAVAAARALILCDDLHTRAEWRQRGALRRGRVYLEEADLVRLERAESML